MISAYVGYHVVLAALAGVLAVLAAGFVIRGLVHRRRLTGATEQVIWPSRIAIAATALLGAAAGVLCLANLSTALQPVPALGDVFATPHDRAAVSTDLTLSNNPASNSTAQLPEQPARPGMSLDS